MPPPAIRTGRFSLRPHVVGSVDVFLDYHKYADYQSIHRALTSAPLQERSALIPQHRRVIDRLDACGLVKRGHSNADRRVRLLSLTSEGKKLLDAVVPAMLGAQERILAPLSLADQHTFLRIIEYLVITNNDLSRAPSEQD